MYAKNFSHYFLRTTFYELTSMANILPLEYQKKVRSSTRARFITAASIVAIASAFVAFLALLPSYIAIRYGIPGEQAPVSVPGATPSDRAEITEAQQLLEQLGSLVIATTTPAQAILAALAGKPVGLSLQRITYTAGSPGGSGQVLLVGVSQSPDLITQYRDTLAKDSHFQSVSVPVGALVGTKDGRFTITLGGHF